MNTEGFNSKTEEQIQNPKSENAVSPRTEASVENEKEDQISPSEALELLDLNDVENVSWRDIEKALRTHDDKIKGEGEAKRQLEDLIFNISEENFIEGIKDDTKAQYEKGEIETQRAIENFFGLNKEASPEETNQGIFGAADETIVNEGPVQLEKNPEPEKSFANQLMGEFEKALEEKPAPEVEKKEEKPVEKNEKKEQNIESDAQKVKAKLDRIITNSTAIFLELENRGVNSDVNLLKKYLDSSDRKKLEDDGNKLNEKRVEFLKKQCLAVKEIALSRVFELEGVDSNNKEGLKELYSVIKKAEIRKKMKEMEAEEITDEKDEVKTEKIDAVKGSGIPEQQAPPNIEKPSAPEAIPDFSDPKIANDPNYRPDLRKKWEGLQKEQKNKRWALQENLKTEEAKKAADLLLGRRDYKIGEGEDKEKAQERIIKYEMLRVNNDLDEKYGLPHLSTEVFCELVNKGYAPEKIKGKLFGSMGTEAERRAVLWATGTMALGATGLFAAGVPGIVLGALSGGMLGGFADKAGFSKSPLIRRLYGDIVVPKVKGKPEIFTEREFDEFVAKTQNEFDEKIKKEADKKGTEEKRKNEPVPLAKLAKEEVDPIKPEIFVDYKKEIEKIEQQIALLEGGKELGDLSDLKLKKRALFEEMKSKAMVVPTKMVQPDKMNSEPKPVEVKTEDTEAEEGSFKSAKPSDLEKSVAKRIEESIKLKSKKEPDIVDEIENFLNLNDVFLDKKEIEKEIVYLRDKYSKKNKEKLSPKELEDFDKVNKFLDRIRKIAEKEHKSTVDATYDLLKGSRLDKDILIKK